MDLKKLREMLKLVAESDVAEIEIDEDGTKVTIRRHAPTISVQPSGFYPQMGMYPPAPPAPHAPTAPATPPPVAPVPVPAAEAAPEVVPDKNETTIKAPIVGTYYSSPSPDAEPFVKVGSRVSPGTVLCIIEAMKLMNEIECEESGTVTQILVENTDPVEYDQPLFVIEKDA